MSTTKAAFVLGNFGVEAWVARATYLRARLTALPSLALKLSQGKSRFISRSYALLDFALKSRQAMYRFDVWEREQTA